MSYQDQDQGVVLVSKEALDNMGPSFRNCPVIFVPEHHNDQDKETAFNFEDIGSNPAAGIVTTIPAWGDDGWQWVEMSVWDEDAQNAIEKGFSVSCAYEPEEAHTGGIWHELEYDREVVNGKYMHMAIVPRPRYEGSRILANSKGGPGMGLFGIKPKANAAMPAKPEPEKKPEAAAGGEQKPVLVNDDTSVDVNGASVPLYKLIEAFMMKQGASGGEAQTLTPEDEVSLPDGTKVKVADLIAAYGGGAEAEPADPLQNAETVQDVVAEKPNDEKKQLSNSAGRKVNTALKNAAARGMDADPREGMDTQADRLARGHARYSIPVKQGGNK
jgi:hypothetical protein